LQLSNIATPANFEYSLINLLIPQFAEVNRCFVLASPLQYQVANEAQEQICAKHIQ